MFLIRYYDPGHAVGGAGYFPSSYFAPTYFAAWGGGMGGVIAPAVPETRILQLSPAPSGVDYPPLGLGHFETTRDASPSWSRPLVDARPRKWIWEGYPWTYTPFREQCEILSTLLYVRRRSPEYPSDDRLIEIWEDGTGAGGFGEMLPGHEGEAPDTETGSNLNWITVRGINLVLSPAKGGGRTRYERAVFEFRIEDAGYTQF